MHNDVMNGPKPPEKPTEERIGEMIGKIIFRGLCLLSLGLFDNISRSDTFTLISWSRAAKQLRRRPSPRLILEIDIRELLSAVVAHDKLGVHSPPRYLESLLLHLRLGITSGRQILNLYGCGLPPPITRCVVIKRLRNHD
jgi:hypothetical protein